MSDPHLAVARRVEILESNQVVIPIIKLPKLLFLSSLFFFFNPVQGIYFIRLDHARMKF